MNERSIVHADMDAFFAAIEQRDNPAYRSKPVIVGADPKKGKGRGVVSTCSYEARRFGIHSAMPISVAYRKCSHAIFLPVDMARYEAVSRDVYRAFDSFTPDVEPVGIDEAFLDITHSHHLFGTPLDTCRKLKDRIRAETGLTASVGLAPTMMAAKIASDLRKPDGLVEVKGADLRSFLSNLEIGRLWGLGKKSEAFLHGLGIRTIGELAASDRNALERSLGAAGGHFWELANGIDNREVTPHTEARSVGNETTFSADTSDNDIVLGELSCLCEKVSGRLREAKLKARTITLKIRLGGFETFTRSETAACATNYFDVLYKVVKELYNTFDRKGSRVRLVGVKASNLVPSGSAATLFDTISDDKREKAHIAIDRITGKFGHHAIRRAASVSKPF